jgi:spore germination protein
MDGNLITTLLALILYLASGIFGHGSNSGQSSVPKPPASYSNQNYPRSGIISVQQANLRSAASNNAAISQTLAKGNQVTVLAEKDQWVMVETSDSRKGWVAKWLVDFKSLPTLVKNTRKVVAGYYVGNSGSDNLGYQSLINNISNINMIIPFSFKIDQYGMVSGNHNTKPANVANTSGAYLLALVNNIQGRNFNSNTIHRMLSNSAARSRAVNGISRLLKEKGYRGVNIDFENVPPRDRIYLTAFFRELSTALRSKGLLVTASVPAKSYNETSSSHSGAYDYQAIAPYLDQVMIMAYDEHYSGGPAGPVASYPWVERVINYAMRYFPPSKIIIGIAGYGYDWSSFSGKAKNYNAIQRLVNKYKIFPKWHSVYKVPYFTYKSWGVKHEVWYENSHSTAAKLSLIRKYHLRGVALWRLGYEDPAIWKVIRQGLY